MAQKNINTLNNHLTAVKKGKRRFENAFQSVTRMILDSGMDKVVVNGRTTYNFKIFRTGRKHIIGMYDELNSFVSYVKDAAEGGSSKEMAYVLVGEPGHGKTFFVEFLCNMYRNFLNKDENRKYTFKFTNLEKFGSYGKIPFVESQTYEDPMILAMNLFEDPEKNREYISRKGGFSDKQFGCIFKLLKKVSYRSGEYIFEKGTKPGYIYIVKSGNIPYPQ